MEPRTLSHSILQVLHALHYDSESIAREHIKVLDGSILFETSATYSLYVAAFGKYKALLDGEPVNLATFTRAIRTAFKPTETKPKRKRTQAGGVGGSTHYMVIELASLGEARERFRAVVAGARKHLDKELGDAWDVAFAAQNDQLQAAAEVQRLEEVVKSEQQKRHKDESTKTTAGPSTARAEQ